MSLVPYLTDSPLPEMDCAPFIALGIAFAIATNLLNSKNTEINEENCESTDQQEPFTRETFDVGVQTDPDVTYPVCIQPVTVNTNTSYLSSYTQNKANKSATPVSYVPKYPVLKENNYVNMDNDIIAILTASKKPLNYKDILTALKRNTNRGLLYENIKKHEINVRLYTMLTDKLVKKISENPSECPLWSLP